jgi:hypothetical protein
VSGVQGDVANPADLDRLYETIAKVKGRLDIVFANAGLAEFVLFGAITEEHFDKLFNINVRGTLFAVQKTLPLLKDGGSIILNGSVASVKGTAGYPVSPAAHAGAKLKIDLYDCSAVVRRRFDVLDVVYQGGETLLERSGQPGFQVSGFSPVYVQATEITRMSIFGKMSVGVRRITAGLSKRNSARELGSREQ